jgi:hypothetical protein
LVPKGDYFSGAYHWPSSSTGAGFLAGSATKRTRPPEFNRQEAVRLFESGDIGDGRTLDFVSVAGIGSSLSLGIGLSAFSCWKVGCGEAFDAASAGATITLDAAAPHDEHPDGAP